MSDRASEQEIDHERRFVIRAVLALLPAACAGPVAQVPPALHQTPPATVLGTVPASVITVGQLYLDLFPEEGNPAALRERLKIADASEPEVDRLARINKSVLAEIEADTMVDIGGWKLAPTECRLYALAALSG